MTKIDQEKTAGVAAPPPPGSAAPPGSAGGVLADGVPAGGVPLSSWARALLGAGAVVTVVALVIQLTAMFLGAGPTNAVSRRYDAELRRWSQPWLDQNWRLFAPDPARADLDILARVRTASGAVGPWVDLSAADSAALRHDPWPSRASQFELTRAWYGYAYRISLVGAGTPNPAQLEVLRQYLRNVIVGRLRAEGGGSGPAAQDVRAVQARSVTTPVPPPGVRTRPRPVVATLPWWDVPPGLAVSE